MDVYKHSCPYCSQHIEYTAGYCGKQMQCPICGQTIVFPAIPPSRGVDSGNNLKLKTAAAAAVSKWSFKIPKSLIVLRDYQHWNVVAQCAVPFLILGVLLAGANYVRKHFSESAPEAIPAVQADPLAWQHMTDLNKADEAVRGQLQAVALARRQVALAEHTARTTSASTPQWQGAQEQLKTAQCNLDAARKQFETVFSTYQQLGGSADYRSRLPN